MKLNIDNNIHKFDSFSLYDSYINQKKSTQLPLLLTGSILIYNSPDWLNQISLFDKNILYL